MAFSTSQLKRGHRGGGARKMCLMIYNLDPVIVCKLRPAHCYPLVAPLVSPATKRS